MKPWDRMWNAIGDYFEAKAEDLFDARAEEWARGYEEGKRDRADLSLIGSPVGDEKGVRKRVAALREVE